MPAKEETYHSQSTLHIVFAVSSVAMFVSITWMIVADHFREWKILQRDFIKFDAAKTEKDSREAKLLASKEELKQLEKQLAAAREQASGVVAEAERAKRKILGDAQRKEQELSFQKAERDSIASFYDIEVDKGNHEKAEEIKQELSKMDAELATLRQESEKLNAELDEAEQKKVEANAASNVTDLEKEIQAKKKEMERVQQKRWTIWSALRSSPVLDAFSPAVKVDQVVLDQLPIHYSFKGVPRFDRCTTCHKGIDAVTRDGGPAYDSKTVEELSTSPYREAFHTHPNPELFAGPNSPHPREKFGCTSCHLGQGSATSFVFASHSPNDFKELDAWKEKYGWEEVHHWPWPMNKKRFMASGCLKCHPYVVDLDSPKSDYIPSVQKLVQGYNIVREYGCFGCHEINGWKNGRLIGPDLRLEPQTPEERKKAEADLLNPPGTMRKVGPTLRHIADKVPEEWTYRWVRLPKGFRPNTRMPQFYGLTNNSGELPGSDKNDLVKSSVELHAIVHYLYTNSQPAVLREIPGVVAVDPKNPDQIKRGKARFIERGCLACHTHQEVPTAEYPEANATFGPDLSNVAVKLKLKDGSPNTRWLFDWLKDPQGYHSTTFMPNLQLKDDEAADIAAWLLSVPGTWADDPGRPPLDEKVLDELITLFLQKATTLKKTREILEKGLSEKDAKTTRGEEKMLVEPITVDKKLEYLGKKTISRLGCFGCHDIPGFETAKPIGTQLADWGVKARMDPYKLLFAHVAEYLEGHTPETERHNPDFELFFDEIKHHKGEAFLWQKLRNPRSYDYDMLKTWDDKLRMPRFPFADDPEAVDAVMTFVLGLVQDDQIPQHLRYVPRSGPKLARIEGEKALVKYNCRGCHVTQMTEFGFDLEKAELPDPASQHRDDFPATAADQKALAHRVINNGATRATVSAMLVDALPSGLERPGQIPSDAEVLALDLWEPVDIADKAYYIGDRFNIPIEAMAQNGMKPAKGGAFANLLVTHLMRMDRKTVRDVWGFVPPPLVREGVKVQPAWVHQFLLNPIEIRPAVRLRMPRFNMSNQEATSLAAYFAAIDDMTYPSDFIRERDDVYLSEKEESHPNYLKDAWALLKFEPKGEGQASQKLCANCHRVAGKSPEGGKAEDKGPNLLLSTDRLRADWLRQWIATPKRVLPYTAMPNNFSAATEQVFDPYFRGTSYEQLVGVRDAIMNYHRIQQDELYEKNATPTSTGGNLP